MSASLAHCFSSPYCPNFHEISLVAAQSIQSCPGVLTVKAVTSKDEKLFPLVMSMSLIESEGVVHPGNNGIATMTVYSVATVVFAMLACSQYENMYSRKILNMENA